MQEVVNEGKDDDSDLSPDAFCKWVEEEDALICASGQGRKNS